jgi:PAS domain S-box-containing protein
VESALSLEWLQDLETRAKASLGRFVAPQSDTDRMLHELRVHRVELEMQNDELQRSQLELGQVVDRYRDLLAAAPLGYLAVDTEGRICETNPLAARLLGGEESELHGRHIQSFLTTADADRFHLRFRACLQTHTAQRLEVGIARRPGPAVYVRLQLAPIAAEAVGDRRCWLFMTDLSEQIEWNERLEEHKLEIASRLPESVAAEADQGTARRVLLLVDDDPSLLYAVARMLSLEEDYRVITASSGEEALEIAESDQRLDVLLTDVRMAGGMDGGELGRRMATLRPELPRLYMSGDLGDVILEKKATCIAKPFRSKELLVTLKEHLSR